MTCPCCDGKDIGVVYSQIGDKMHFVEGNFSLLRCKRCKLEFISPLLNEGELSKYYPKQDYYSFKEKDVLNRMYHKLSVYFYSKKNPLVWILVYPFKSLLYTYYIDKGKRLLEIGCGRGMQLELYNKEGMETYGLEPYGPELTERERKLGIARTNIKDARFPNGYFDYIVMKEVLEHIPNQKEALRKCHELLKPHGKLIIVVQNTKSLWGKVFGRNWIGYDVPRHLYNYNTKNIAYFLKRNGFKVINVRSYDITYMITGSLNFYFSSNKKAGFPWIASGIFNLLFTPVSLVVSWLGLGSLMEIVCEK